VEEVEGGFSFRGLEVLECKKPLATRGGGRGFVTARKLLEKTRGKTSYFVVEGGVLMFYRGRGRKPFWV